MEHLLMNMAKSSNVSPDDIQHYINNTTDKMPIDDDSNDDTTATTSPFTDPVQVRPPDTHMEEQLESAKEGKYAYLGSSSGVYMLKRLFPEETQDSAMDQVPNSRTLVQANEDDIMVARFGHKSNQLSVGPGACESAPESPSPHAWVLPPKPVVDRLVKM